MSDGETSGGMEARVVAGAWLDCGSVCALGASCAKSGVFTRLVERLGAQEWLAVGGVDGGSGALSGAASVGPGALACRRGAGSAAPLRCGRVEQSRCGSDRRRDGLCKKRASFGRRQVPG